jgi:hypothetical protein
MSYSNQAANQSSIKYNNHCSFLRTRQQHPPMASNTSTNPPSSSSTSTSSSKPSRLRECCRELRRENELLRTQLNELQLQRTLEEQLTSRRLQELADSVRAELSREILEMLQGEFACSICSEVRPNPS